jgi:hypothetical protein
LSEFGKVARHEIECVHIAARLQFSVYRSRMPTSARRHENSEVFIGRNSATSVTVIK